MGIRLYTRAAVDLPTLSGCVVRLSVGRSAQWPVQYYIDKVPLHPESTRHEEELTQFLYSAGAVTDFDAALVTDEMTLRLRNAVNVEDQVLRAFGGVTFRYQVLARQLEAWTYYAGIRVTFRRPFPDVTTVSLKYLETAEDLTSYDIDVVTTYQAEVRTQYDQLTARLKEQFAAVAIAEEEEPAPYPFWDKSSLWLQLRFWQEVYRQTAETGLSQPQILARLGVPTDTAKSWRKKLLLHFDETILHQYQAHDAPPIETLVNALRSG